MCLLGCRHGMLVLLMLWLASQLGWAAMSAKLSSNPARRPLLYAQYICAEGLGIQCCNDGKV